jgi:prepilin-type N-terminal cleavage/methylation domain-containing protein
MDSDLRDRTLGHPPSPPQMKDNIPARACARRGMTLIELSVVIVVLILMITVVFAGGSAWKRGSDRAGCAMELRKVHLAVESYQNMYGYGDGTQAEPRCGTRDISRHLVGMGYITPELHDRVMGIRPCRCGGRYECSSPDVFPQTGQPYVRCSSAESRDQGLASTRPVMANSRRSGTKIDRASQTVSIAPVVTDRRIDRFTR